MKEEAAAPSAADWRLERDPREGSAKCEDGKNSDGRLVRRRGGASPFSIWTLPRTVVILVLCLLLLADSLATSRDEYGLRRLRRQRRLRSR